MIGQMTGQMRPQPKNAPLDAWNRNKAEIMQTIDGLHVQSRRGLWRLLLFIATSALFLQFRNFDLFAALPASICEILGAPPPLVLIHVLLAVSSCSALILIAGRGEEASRGCSGWVQFGLSVAFYPLYAAANALSDCFPVVFAAGLLILVLDHFTAWGETTRAIRAEEERLGRLS